MKNVIQRRVLLAGVFPVEYEQGTVVLAGIPSREVPMGNDHWQTNWRELALENLQCRVGPIDPCRAQLALDGIKYLPQRHIHCAAAVADEWCSDLLQLGKE